jgi:ribose transport system ATP-binding protein
MLLAQSDQVRRGMLRLTGISKNFPGVQALSVVNLEVRPGEIHGLLGENGAGKSTLIKIIAGAYAADQGEMIFDGAPVRWSSPREAKQHGVQVVYQEFALFPQLSVAENIFVGHERRNRFGIVDHARTRREAREVLERLGVSLDPRASVASLSVADQQMVEIARAIACGDCAPAGSPSSSSPIILRKYSPYATASRC